MAENKNTPPVKRGPGSTKKAVEKAKDFKGTTKKLVKNYLSIYKWQMIIVIIFAIGSTIFTIVGPKVLGNATTEIFVFDDSFSALDLKTDSKLRSALKEKTENKTVIIVAQRISTILDADKIIVLEEGKIAGIGKHEELINTCEVYKQIALSQLSKEELENGRK